MAPRDGEVLPLRFGWFWAAVGWSGVGLGIVLSMLPRAMMPVPLGGTAQHLAGYFILTAWFAGIYPSARYPDVGLGCFLFGCSMELLQILSPTRHPQLQDALTNAVGILAALAFAYAGLGGWAAPVEKLLGVAPR
ncbi:MAG TPA: VanZ family protein [Steroidobacteraceae bacterium]|nr:VanZ family protein [Steroidobacteraceae bacterium]